MEVDVKRGEPCVMYLDAAPQACALPRRGAVRKGLLLTEALPTTREREYQSL
jgi:hypothetical protein